MVVVADPEVEAVAVAAVAAVAAVEPVAEAVEETNVAVDAGDN
jgi:hypothetical protein